jgi:osmotically-inducible protein OsmY
MNVSQQIVLEAEREDSSASGGLMIERSRRLIGQSTTISMFKTIPPERVGLHGEYDHQGLAKRVSMALRQHFSLAEINGLRVTQRGAVVILIGKIPNQRLLIKIVNIAMTIPGTADVEVNGVSIGYSLKNYLEVKPSRETLLKLQKLMTS